MDEKLNKLDNADLEEVEEEISREESYDVDEEENTFDAYEKDAKPSVFSRMWLGLKNVFSADDEDYDEMEASQTEKNDYKHDVVNGNKIQDINQDKLQEKASHSTGYFNGLKHNPDKDSDDESGEEVLIAEKKVFSASSLSAAGSKPAGSVNFEQKKKIPLAHLDDDDMGRMIKISVGILERLPQNEFEKFKSTDDFRIYKDIIKKYKKR